MSDLNSRIYHKIGQNFLLLKWELRLFATVQCNNTPVIYQLKEQVGCNMFYPPTDSHSFHANEIYIKDATLTITTHCLTHFMLLKLSAKKKIKDKIIFS